MTLTHCVSMEDIVIKSSVPDGSKDVESNECPTKITCELGPMHLFVDLLVLGP